MKAAVLTLSDRSARGEREDTSGPTLVAFLKEQGVEVSNTDIIPDEEEHICTKLIEWADSGDYDLILTTGGTGVSPRDVTPEATSRIADRIIPGFGELMRLRSLEKTPMAALSRALAAVRGQTLIINLPGSPKAALENIEAAWPAVPHGIEKIQGDPSDCANLYNKTP